MLFRPLVRRTADLRRTEGELYLRAELLDSATDSIFLHDLEGDLIYVNDTACKAHGYTRDELMRMNLKDLTVPGFTGLFQQRIQALREEGEATFESADYRKDGPVLPLEVHAHLIQCGDEQLILSVARDITERKQAEQALCRIEDSYRSIFETAAGLVFSVSKEGDIVDCNPRIGPVLGYAPEDVIGRPMSLIFDGGHQARAQQDFVDIMEQGGTGERECKMVRGDGTEIEVTIKSSVLKNSLGGPDGMICVVSAVRASLSDISMS